jgi:DNA-binding NtrC family response regulator
MNPLPLDEQWPLKVLIVDDERSALRYLAEVLEAQGPIELYRASSLQEARQVLEQALIDIAFIDLRLSEDIRNRDGLTLVQEMRGRYQTIPIMVSGHSQLDEVREAMKLGARDYVHKPEIEQRVPIILQEIRRELATNRELIQLRTRDLPDPAMGLIGTSVAMQNLRALIQKMVASPVLANILILGPTGAGKEVVARVLHQSGTHRNAPFLDLNCGAIAETLIEDQLFGHVRGAFTDAKTDQEGYFSLVGHGTLFLDEIGELSLGLQSKLLRVLETRTFRPLGPTARELQFKGRIVAATHVDLKERVRQKLFREDLYYRLNVLTLQVPPLSDHREDIPALVQHFAKKHSKPLHFAHEAIELLRKRPWRGNVRELRTAIDRLAIFVDSGLIDASSIEQHVPLEEDEALHEDLLALMAQKVLELPIDDKIGAMTEALVRTAIEKSGRNITEAARLLGRHRKFVERFLKKRPRNSQRPPKPRGDG